MSRHRPGILVERDTVGRRRNTDKFVSYTNANKEGAGNDVNRARFRFLYPSLCMWCAATLIVFSVDVRNGPAGWPGGQSGRSEEM